MFVCVCVCVCVSNIRFVIMLIIFCITSVHIIAAVAYGGAFFGEGRGPILQNELTCTGTESILLECTSNFGEGMCTHAQDAGVDCAGMQCV